MAEEKIFVIPLGQAKEVPHYKRARRAAKLVREYLVKHMKSENVKVDPKINEKLFERGVKKPPARIRVKAVKEDDGSVNASLVE